MKTIEKQKTRKTILSIFAVAVFLLGVNTVQAQCPNTGNAPSATCVPLGTVTGVVLPTDGSAVVLNPVDFDMGSIDDCPGMVITISPATVSCADLGGATSATIAVTLTATDAEGLTDMCVTDVGIVETIPTAVCQNISVFLDAAGSITVNAAEIDGGSESCSAITMMTIDGGASVMYSCADVGTPQLATLVVTNATGASTPCMATITVLDNVNPTFTCPSGLTVALSGACEIVIPDLLVGIVDEADACGVPTMSQVPAAGMTVASSNGGTTDVVVTATDTNGNAVSCNVTLTGDDTTLPTATCQPVTVVLDGAGNGSIVAADVNDGSTDNCGITSMSLSQTAFTCAHVATNPNMVTLTVMDGAGNMATCMAAITVEDNTPPPAYPDLPIAGTIPNSLGDCQATVSWSATLLDNCAGPVVTTITSATDEKGNTITVLTAGPSHFGDFPVGVNTVNYTATDGTNMITSSFTITVIDTEPPTIVCPADQNQEVPACAAATQVVPNFIGSSAFSDNCSINLSVTQDPAPNTLLSTLPGVSPADGETYTVTITVDDGFTTTTCGPFTVTLVENNDPQPDVPGATLPLLTSTCGPLVVTAPTATDACGNPVCGDPFPVDPAVWTQVPGTGPCPGATTFDTYNGASNPQSIPATGTGGFPCVGGPSTSIATVPLMGNIGLASGEFSIENVTVNLTHTFDGDLEMDLISPAGTIWDLSSDNGGAGNNFTNTIFEDGNPSITTGSAPFTGTFQAEEGPFATGFAGDAVNGDWTLSICDDAVGDTGTLLSWSITFSSLPVGSVPEYEFAPGNHVITWIYDDGFGNASQQLQQINVSNDAIDPVVSCQDITVELDAFGNASIVVDDLIEPNGFTMEMTEDFGNNANNPGRVNMSVTATSNTTFTFDWDYENMDPGFEALSYYVNGGPLPNGTIITAATGIGTTSVPLNMGDIFTIEILTTDNLFGENSSVTIDNFNQGFTGDYSLGNWTFSETGVLNALMTVLDGDPSDDCTDLATLLPTLAISQSAFDCADIGAAIPVTLSVEDEAGNIGDCIAMVTVVDVLAPVLILNSGSVADLTVNCDNIPAPNANITANDNCDGALTVNLSAVLTQSNNPASCAFYTYTMTRTWSATDANSNEGTIVQVLTIEDNDAPSNPTIAMNIPANDTLSTDAVGCTASVSLAVNMYDDCADFANLTITNNSIHANAGGADASGDYPLGFHAVNFTAIDPCGNSSTHTESFWVVDQIAPVASCVNSLNLGLPSSGVLTLSPNNIDNGSSDECSGVTLSVSPNTFGCADVGIPRTVTLTVMDAAGNLSTCTTTITLQDNNAPTALCQAVSVTLDANGNASVPSSAVDNGSFDDCTPVTLSPSAFTFTELDLGVNTVTLTVTDTSGNSTTCNAIITVNLPPTCFEVGIATGGAGEVISVPVTSDNFTALVGFQFELQLNQEMAGEFVGVSTVHPDLTNAYQAILSNADSTFNPIDTLDMQMPYDSIVFDTILDFNSINFSWNQFNTGGMGGILPLTFADGTILFYVDILLTGNIGDFSIISGNLMSSTTPPEVVYSFGSGFIPQDACIQQGAITIGQLIIAGDIYNEGGHAINLVDVDLYQPPSPLPIQSDQTMTDGAYSFTVAAAGSFVIAPSKNINWSNGIDIVDVSLIQRHTVGNPYVSTAYKKIAADVSGDAEVTTFDAVLLNAYIASLFMGSTPPTPSWQFSDAKESLSNNPNAFVPGFTNTITLLGVSSDSLGNDFIAIKTGDLGGLQVADTTMIIGNPDDRNDSALKFVIEDRTLSTGEKISIDFNAENFEQMVAYQWILTFDNEVLEYTGFDNVNIQNAGALTGFGEVIIEEGKLVMTWATGSEVTKSPEELLFSLNFEVKANANHLSDLLSVSSYENFDAVAYQGLDTPMDIELDFTQAEVKSSVFALHQNTPNPFKEETVISFTLPETTDATLTIMDVTGRVLKQYEGDFTQGYNEITIQRSDLPYSGTLFYELKTAEHTASMKMIIID